MHPGAVGSAGGRVCTPLARRQAAGLGSSQQQGHGVPTQAVMHLFPRSPYVQFTKDFNKINTSIAHAEQHSLNRQAAATHGVPHAHHTPSSEGARGSNKKLQNNRGPNRTQAIMAQRIRHCQILCRLIRSELLLGSFKTIAPFRLQDKYKVTYAAAPDRRHGLALT